MTTANRKLPDERVRAELIRTLLEKTTAKFPKVPIEKHIISWSGDGPIASPLGTGSSFRLSADEIQRATLRSGGNRAPRRRRKR